MPTWVEILKTGTFQDSRGRTHSFSADDLDGIVAKYDPASHEAPVTIGHPKDNAPAYGWVKRLKRAGETLLAEFKDLVPEFVEMVKAGLFKKRSVSLFPDMSLRHVGFLGAAPPAVKGLSDVSFAEQDEEIALEQEGTAAFAEETPPAPVEKPHRDFSDWRVPQIGSIFTSLREWIIEKFGAEEADKVASNYQLDELKQWIPDTGTCSCPVCKAALAEGPASMCAVPTAEIPALAEAQAENTRLKAELETERTRTRRAAAATFCDGLTREGRLVPAHRVVVLDLLEALHAAGEIEFSEGGKASAATRFREYLSACPKQVEFAEVARGGAGPIDFSDPEAAKMALIEKHKKENPGASDRDAVLAVAKSNPELFHERR